MQDHVFFCIPLIILNGSIISPSIDFSVGNFNAFNRSVYVFFNSSRINLVA